jgi:hypothetical protein
MKGILFTQLINQLTRDTCIGAVLLTGANAFHIDNNMYNWQTQR